ncbi:glucosaminidase domain-containing protein [bacterium]|nr:glucosaminidase domain-containing protein [bacterium]
MHKLIYASIWCLSTSIFLLTICFLLGQNYLPEKWFWQHENQVLGDHIEIEQPADTEPEATTSTTKIADARAVIVANFIERNDAGKNSPLQPYDYWGEFFVQVADEYGLDFRLLPAIARKESTFCKSNIARTYYNCFGYGVPASGITEAGKFSSYEEGIRTVASSLKKSYIDKGLTDPMAIMAKYCPPSAEGNGSWSRNINQWLAEMRYDDKAAGLQNADNADLTEFTP